MAATTEDRSSASATWSPRFTRSGRHVRRHRLGRRTFQRPHRRLDHGTDSADLPWHRVLGASGRPAAHLARRQLAKLELEGCADPGRSGGSRGGTPPVLTGGARVHPMGQHWAMQTFGPPGGHPPRSCSPVDVRPGWAGSTNPASSWRAVGCSTPHWTPSPTVIGWSRGSRTATTCRPRSSRRRSHPPARGHGRRAGRGPGRARSSPATSSCFSPPTYRASTRRSSRLSSRACAPTPERRPRSRRTTPADCNSCCRRGAGPRSPRVSTRCPTSRPAEKSLVPDRHVTLVCAGVADCDTPADVERARVAHVPGPMDITTARTTIRNTLAPLPIRASALGEALGATLAAPLVAAEALPRFDVSAMDGYAVSGRGPWRLHTEIRYAGRPPISCSPRGRGADRDRAPRSRAVRRRVIRDEFVDVAPDSVGRARGAAPRDPGARRHPSPRRGLAARPSPRRGRDRGDSDARLGRRERGGDDGRGARTGVRTRRGDGRRDSTQRPPARRSDARLAGTCAAGPAAALRGPNRRRHASPGHRRRLRQPSSTAPGTPMCSWSSARRVAAPPTNSAAHFCVPAPGSSSDGCAVGPEVRR